MNKSIKPVRAALQTAGLKVKILEVSKGTRTAQAAANAASCEVDQIAKSIISRNEEDGSAVLFITAGGKKICAITASALVGGTLGKADAKLIRAQTGFAIGGVSPIGHLSQPRAFFDPRLLECSLTP